MNVPEFEPYVGFTQLLGEPAFVIQGDQVLCANAPLAAAIGFRADAIEGWPFDEFAYDAAAANRWLQCATRSASPIVGTLSLRCSNGDAYSFEFRANVLNPSADNAKIVLFREERLPCKSARSTTDTSSQLLGRNAVPDHILLALNIDETIDAINEHGCLILGCDADAAIGVNWFDTFVPERHRNQSRSAFKRFVAGESVLAGPLENSVVTTAGNERVVAWSNTLLTDEHGGVTGTLSTGVDITDRRQRDQLYETVLQGTQIVPWKVDVATERFTYVGPHFEQLLGYPADRWPDLSAYFDTIHDDCRDAICMKRRREMAAGRDHTLEYQMVRADGNAIWIRDVASVIYKDGSPQELVGFMFDITEQKRVEEERSRLSRVIEQSSEAVIMTDVNGIVTYVNPAFETVTGYSRAEIVGRSISLLKSDRHSNEFYRELWETIQSGRVWKGRFVNRRKNGVTYTAESAISPIVSDSGTISGYVSVKRDISRELELEGQLLQAQKMDAVGRLAGGLAHDFNNLLTVILGYAAQLLSALPDDDPHRERVMRIQEAGSQGTALTRQLLAFSRKQVLQPRLTDLDELVRYSVGLLRRVIGEDINVDVVLDAGGGVVRVDPSQFEQVMMNLAVNSRQAMTDGGTLRISTTIVELGALPCAGESTDATSGRHVCIVFSDTGDGIPDDILPLIFDPFFTTKKTGEGTGLGLATVHGIVTQSGGRVTVNSEVGTGTTFRIYLPLVDGNPESLTTSSLCDAVAAPAGKGETILVVEDDEKVRELVVMTLTDADYTVIAASNPLQALALVSRKERELDLLLTDVVMPGMRGPELADKLLTLAPDLPVIFMSGYQAESMVERGELRSGVNFLEKPLSVARLLSTVRSVLEKRSPDATVDE